MYIGFFKLYTLLLGWHVSRDNFIIMSLRLLQSIRDWKSRNLRRHHLYIASEWAGTQLTVRGLFGQPPKCADTQFPGLVVTRHHTYTA